MKVVMTFWNAADSANLSKAGAPLSTECRTNAVLIQALSCMVEKDIQSYTLPNAESVPFSTKKLIPLIMIYDAVEAGFENPLALHEVPPSVTTTSRYFSVRFVPAAKGSEIRARLSDRIINDEPAGMINANSYFELRYIFDGMAVGGTRVGVTSVGGMEVGGMEVVGMEVGGMEVGEMIVGNGVREGIGDEVTVGNGVPATLIAAWNAVS